MKNELKRKLIISIIISIVLIGCFFVAHVISSVTEILAKQNGITERKIDTIVFSLDSIYSVKDELHNEFEHLSRNNLKVMRCLLKEFIEDGQYTGPVLFEDGAVASYTDGVLVYPDHEARLSPEIDAVSFRDLLNSSGTLTSKADINGETKDVAVSAIEIIHPYYYGILKVANDNMTLSILAECKEEDFHRVQRFLNREIYLLLKANQITTK